MTIYCFLNSNFQNLRDLEQATDKKFMELEGRIKTCRKSLEILESRIESIPFLVTAATVPHVNSAIEPDPRDTKLPAEHDPEAICTEHQEPTPEINESARDPRLDKYYRMLKVGVPLEAVKIKMVSEELDPNLLVL